MWGIISTTFLGIYCLMSYYIVRRGCTIMGDSFSPFYRKVFWCFLGLTIFSFPISELTEDFLPAAGGFWLTLWGWYSMVAVVYLFLFVLFIDLFRLLDQGIGFVPVRIKDSTKTPIVLGASVILMVILTLAYGTWNARNPIVTNYEITMDKEAGSLKQLRIAMISDIHYGAIIDAQRLESMVKIVNQLKPDLILFAGDIVEGSPTQAETKKLAAIFNEMHAKYGKFAVPGNHDRALRNDKELLYYFKEAGISVLRDDYIRVGNSFYVIGRDDPGHGRRQRRDLSYLVNGVDPSYPLIVLDHQPIDLKKAHENNIDLQLSGHTHRGQIFPSQFITGQIYDLDWGLLKKGSYHLIVSSGYGTWGPPMRIGNRPEVVYVKVNFR